MEPENRRMEASEKVGYTLTTNRPTIDGTTDNAPRRTTGGAEMLNIDALYSVMSSTSTRSNGTPVLSNHKFFENFQAAAEAANIMLTAESKAQDINSAVEENQSLGKRINRHFNAKGDTIGEIEVAEDDPYNERGEGDTLRWGINQFNN